MVAFGHLLFERIALSSLNRVCSSSSSSSSSVAECLLPCECAKWSRVDDDDDNDSDIESASCEIIPGVNRMLLWLLNNEMMGVC